MTKKTTIVLSCVITALCILPLLLSSFYLSIATEILILGIFALSLNILLGYTGLVSLGHAAFFGVGAYTAGLVGKNISEHLLVTLIASLVVSIIVSFIVGYFCTRASGFYFLMLTLAFSQMIYSAFHQWRFAGGSNGLSGIPKPALTSTFNFSQSIYLYFLILIIFLVVIYAVNRFIKSPLGHVLIGIRENETRMKAMGYNTKFYSQLAFVLAGGLGGIAGCLYSYFNGFVSPNDLYWTMSGQVLIMVLVGGAGTILGPILGAGFIVFLETIISSYTELWMLIIGTVFILFVIFAPKGIVGLAQSVKKKLVNRTEVEIIEQIEVSTNTGNEETKSVI
ncbi:branched-chain amino acid ABC transporter permease [Calidifontibacillus oryziterrae]|uniref:branched-chain amino acid ABC transporter permease n=1 Tax=Calidifontibacillus oryziterrae TaxID=1191699 RepID=UPI000314AB32|nr:branched-chain amino acid ABC transporter permease [Calidifontibacillus oryziterrae]